MDFKYYILSFVGLVFLLCKAKIFKSLREGIFNRNRKLGEFVQCTQCLGFWIGMIGALRITFNPIDIFFIGCMVSFLCYTLDIIINKIKTK